MNKNFWKDKSVLVTGHTGFKGSWLIILLKTLEARVSGFSLPATNTNGNYPFFPKNYLEFEALNDVCDLVKFRELVLKCKPDVIFHLAAQASVLESINNPQETWRTNVLGTQNLLEILRLEGVECVCVIVTTDKVYKNLEKGIPFKENDSLGGKDPYSSSKAAVEVLVASYNSSFPIFQHRISLSTARAGNVIGGGDWLQNRIVPDLMKAYAKSDSLHLRNPGSVRPWQHVLDALSGYLLQAEYFSTQSTQNDVRAFNFGPSLDSQITVAGLIDEFSKYLQINKPSIDYSEKKLEAGVLSLDSSLARSQLGWVPTMNFTDSVHATASWYKAYLDGDNPFEVSSQQVINWLTDAD